LQDLDVEGLGDNKMDLTSNKVRCGMDRRD